MGSLLIDFSNSDAEAAEFEADDSVDSTLSCIYDAMDYITSSFKEPCRKTRSWLLIIV